MSVIKRSIYNVIYRFMEHPVLIAILMVSPLLVYFGQQSLIAQDEGYYAVQARWILQTHQWLAPQMFHHIIFDRTMGLQWLIAGSYHLFGVSVFAARLPVLIAAVFCLCLTYQFANLLSSDLKVGMWFAPLSVIILALIPVWLNYAHYAGQEIPLLAAELLGLYAIVKAKEGAPRRWSFMIGPLIAIAFFIKGFMVAIPIAAVAPYLLSYRRSLFKNRGFWLGMLLGCSAVVAWLGCCWYQFGYGVVSQLWKKIIYLSHESHTVYTSHSIFYYVWNVPLNFFPWFFIAACGWFCLLKRNHAKSSVYFLFWYPVVIFILLTLFTTKTPYYPIQMTPFVAMAAAYFILTMVNQGVVAHKLFFRVFAILGAVFCLLIVGIYVAHFFKLFEINPWIQIKRYSLILTALALPWSFIFLTRSLTQRVVLLLIGSWLALVVTVQMGLLNNRRSALQQALNQPVVHHVVSRQVMSFVNAHDSTALSKQMTLLAFNSEKIGGRYSTIQALPRQTYAWAQLNDAKLTSKSIKIIARLPQRLGAWALVYKKE